MMKLPDLHSLSVIHSLLYIHWNMLGLGRGNEQRTYEQDRNLVLAVQEYVFHEKIILIHSLRAPI